MVNLAPAPKKAAHVTLSRSDAAAYARHAMTTRPHSQAPERSLDQRMDALRRANEIRSLRAQLKRDLKAGSISITDVIRNPPEYVQTAKVYDMLMAVPKYGKVKATRFLNHCRISQGKTIGGLSERQRTELVELLGR